jgi:Secretion system C-terminal sorting domain
MEYRILKIAILLLMYSGNFFAQTNITLRKLVKLPSNIKESSGLSYLNNGNFWTNEDSGNKDEIYKCDTLGNLLQIVSITGENNHDWEEIQQDNLGNIYLGDIGNNDNDRKNLRILKFNTKDIVNDKAQNIVQINFNYPDQTKFPPDNDAFYFDVEAFLPIGDSIYLFTKDRSDPYIGGTRVYAIPNKAGNFTAKLVNILSTDNTSYFLGSITGACTNSSKTKVALLSYKRIYLYSNFGNKSFWEGTRTVFDMGTTSQYEGITFIDDCRLLITDEQSVLGGGFVYMLNLCPFTSKSNTIIANTSTLKIYPNPSSNHVIIDYSLSSLSKDVLLRIVNTEGKIIRVFPLNTLTDSITLDTKNYNGIYFVQLFSKQKGVIISQKAIFGN